MLTLSFVVTAPVTLRGGPGDDVISTEATGIGDTADGGTGSDSCHIDASDFRIELRELISAGGASPPHTGVSAHAGTPRSISACASALTSAATRVRSAL